MGYRRRWKKIQTLPKLTWKNRNFGRGIEKQPMVLLLLNSRERERERDFQVLLGNMTNGAWWCHVDTELGVEQKKFCSLFNLFQILTREPVLASSWAAEALDFSFFFLSFAWLLRANLPTGHFCSLLNQISAVHPPTLLDIFLSQRGLVRAKNGF